MNHVRIILFVLFKSFFRLPVFVITYFFYSRKLSHNKVIPFTKKPWSLNFSELRWSAKKTSPLITAFSFFPPAQGLLGSPFIDFWNPYSKIFVHTFIVWFDFPLDLFAIFSLWMLFVCFNNNFYQFFHVFSYMQI